MKVDSPQIHPRSFLLRTPRAQEFWHREAPDRFGDRIHLALALWFAFSLAWPMSVLDVSATSVLACLVIRSWFIRRAVAQLVFQVPFLLCLALFAWQALTIVWTSDRGSAIDQWGATRYASLVASLYPVIHRRGLISLTIVIGFLCASAVQLAAIVGTKLNIPALVWLPPSTDGRIGGWWTPVIAGELLVGALGLHLGAGIRLFALSAALRHWTLPLVGSLACLGGIIASGTRGAWIAATVLLLLCPIAAMRARRRASSAVTSPLDAAHEVPVRLARSARFLIILSLTALLVAVLFAFRAPIQSRLVDARNEISRAAASGEYNTNTGLRLMMARWAWRAFLEAPVQGVGVGDYRIWTLSQRAALQNQPQELLALDQFERDGHGHAHNTPLQALATTGVIGAGLLAAIIVLALTLGFRHNKNASPSPPNLESIYAHSPPVALFALVLLSPFDAINVSAQLAAFLFTCIALCPPWVPPPKPLPGSA